MINPYATQLGSRDPYEVIAATPNLLASYSQSLPADRLNAPIAPGKWSPLQILIHLADTEIAFAFRLRQALSQDHHVIQPFDQDAWMKIHPGATAPSALATFTAVRAWNRELIESAKTEQQLSKPLSHPERGAMTFRTLVETIAGHDLNHLNQIQNLVSSGKTAEGVA